MTNEVPDFEKIANELYEKAKFFQEYYALQDINHELRKAHLAGRKAQVKVDAEIATNYGWEIKWRGEPRTKTKSGVTGEDIAKAIESQAIS